MFGLRLTIDAQPRSKNGQPAHQTTGVASTRPIQFVHAQVDAAAKAHAEHHVAHRQQEDRRAEHRADPEAPRHVDAARDSGPSSSADRARLERHAADRAGARLVADDLRVHRARVFDAHRRARREIGLERHAALRARAGLLLAHLRIHRADVGGSRWRWRGTGVGRRERRRDSAWKRSRQLWCRSKVRAPSCSAWPTASAGVDGHPADRVDPTSVAGGAGWACWCGGMSVLASMTHPPVAHYRVT